MMNAICNTHGRIRCDECSYVEELRDRVKELEEWEVRWSKRQKRLEQENANLRNVVDAATNLMGVVNNDNDPVVQIRICDLEEALACVADAKGN